MDANLARRTLAEAPDGAEAITRDESDQVGTLVKQFIHSHTFRILLVLAALGSSALVLEAGRRWC